LLLTQQVFYHRVALSFLHGVTQRDLFGTGFGILWGLRCVTLVCRLLFMASRRNMACCFAHMNYWVKATNIFAIYCPIILILNHYMLPLRYANSKKTSSTAIISINQIKPNLFLKKSLKTTSSNINPIKGGML